MTRKPTRRMTIFSGNTETDRMSTRQLDGPQRPAWMHSALRPKRSRTQLLLDYIAKRIEIAERSEAKLCRSFLTAFHKATATSRASEAPLPELSICKGSEMTKWNIWCHDHTGIRRDLPRLSMPSTAALASIARETSDNRVVIAAPERELKWHGFVEEPDVKRKPVFGKPEPELIPGRRTS